MLYKYLRAILLNIDETLAENGLCHYEILNPIQVHSSPQPQVIFVATHPLTSSHLFAI